MLILIVLTIASALYLTSFVFFSGSFSFACNDLSQWMQYADRGEGVVLSFKASACGNPKKYIDGFIPDNPTVIVCPMSYCEKELRRVLSKIIKSWDKKDVGELCDHVFMISSLFKDKKYGLEKEYRFFVHHRRDIVLKNQHHAEREQSGNIVSFLDIPIQNWGSIDDFPIYRIGIGPNAPDHLANQLNDFIFSKGLPIPRTHIVQSVPIA